MNKIIFLFVINAFCNPLMSQSKLDSLKLNWNNSHIDIVEGACFDGSSEVLATYSYDDPNFYLWDLKTNKLLKKISVDKGIRNISFDQNKNSYILTLEDKTINWPLSKYQLINKNQKSDFRENNFGAVNLSNENAINNLKKMQIYDNPYFGDWQEYVLPDYSVRIITDLSRFIVMSIDGSKIIFFTEFLDFPIRKLVLSNDGSKICLINSSLGDGGTGNKFVRIYNLKSPKNLIELSPSNVTLYSLHTDSDSKSVYSTTDSSIFYFRSNLPNLNRLISLNNIANICVGENVYATTHVYKNENYLNEIYEYDSLLNFKNKVKDENLLITPLESKLDNKIFVTSDSGIEEFEIGSLKNIKSESFAENYTHNPLYSDELKRAFVSSENKIFSISNQSDVKTYEIFNSDDWSPDGPDILKYFLVKNEYLLVFLTNGKIYQQNLNESFAKPWENLKGIEIKDVERFGDEFYICGIDKNYKTTLIRFVPNESNKDIQLFYLKKFNFLAHEIEIEVDFLFLNTFDEIKVLQLSSLKHIYSFQIFKNNNWLVKIPNSSYYMCSKDASKMLHYVTPSLKVIGFEQLDPVYNRPDIVLDSIGKYFGSSDGGMIDEYRKSWEKRIDRLGLDKEKLGKGEIAVPIAEIIGADEIAYENKVGKVEIKVEAYDSKYTLRRFNVYVNEVPLYGSLGTSLSQMNTHKWDTTLAVPLSYGENKIQVSVMNELGLENFKYPTYVNYNPVNDAVFAKTHYIGIGVNSFINKQYNLTYCVKDVNDLASALGGENTRVKILTDQQVTRENILQLKQYLKDSTTVNDKVIISCSSHGLLDDSLNFYLATHDVDFKHPELRGLKYEELESLLDGIPARQKLLLLDACNSGENDKTELLTNELAQKESKMNGTEVLAARGVIIQLEEENKNNFKKMNELFVNVRNNTGSVIISAAGGQESALEAIEIDGKKIENGAFTYSVLEYLKSNEGNQDALTVNKLKQYVENRVEVLTEGKQKPTSRQETMEVDWRVR